MFSAGALHRALDPPVNSALGGGIGKYLSLAPLLRTWSQYMYLFCLLFIDKYTNGGNDKMGMDEQQQGHNNSEK